MNKTAVKYGIFTGFGVIIYLFIWYLFDKALMRSAVVLWSSMIIYFIGMFLAALAVHRSRGSQEEIEKRVLDSNTGFNVHNRDLAEELPFSRMVGVPFLVFLITNAYFVFFFYWIMNVYDAELLEIHQKLTHQEMLEFYADTEQISEVKKNKLEDYTPTFGGLVSQYFKGAIGGFILSLLIAAGVRRS